MQINFSQHRWDKLNFNWEAWWNHQLARPIVMIEKCLEDNFKEQKVCSLFQSGNNLSINDYFDQQESRLKGIAWYGDSWPRWIPDFGPGIIAGFIGSKVNIATDTVWFEPPEIELAISPTLLDKNNYWYVNVLETTMQALQRWNGTINVGFTDLGGNLDIIASLRSPESLLFDLCDKPADMQHWITHITKMWIEYYNEFYSVLSKFQNGFCSWAPLYSTKRHYMLQSDFSYMISPEMFEYFVMPDIMACCEILDHPFYHMDGRGQLPHLANLLKIEKLKGIQWIPGEGASNAEDYIDVLKQIKEAGKLCQVYVSPEGALKICKTLGGAGFAFKITDTNMSIKDIYMLLSELGCDQ